MRAADCLRQAGDREGAHKLCEQVRVMPNVPAEQKKQAQQRLEQMSK